MGDGTEVVDIELKIIHTTIFSIVVPCKEPCSSYKIRMEYQDLEGEEIPFRDYNFKTLDDFLCAHPMLNPSKNAENKWVFTAKLSQKSAHIQALVAGQKKKKSKSKKGKGGFNRAFNSRASYHGRPAATVGLGDVRKQFGGGGGFGGGSAIGSRQSFTAGSGNRFTAPSKPPTFGGTSTTFGSSSTKSTANGGFGAVRPPPPPSSAYGSASSRASGTFQRVGSARFMSSAVSAAPYEGLRRIKTALNNGKGAATLRNFCKLYANAFLIKFDAEELKRYFKTSNLNEILRDHAEGKIKIQSTGDGSVMIVSTEILEAQAKLAKEMEARAAIVHVIKPDRVYAKAPSIVKLRDDIADLLVAEFPNRIPISELTDRCRTLYNMDIVPQKFFNLSWEDLARNQFKDRIVFKNGQYCINPTYGKAMGLSNKMGGPSPRKKLQNVTLADLGITWNPPSSDSDDSSTSDSEDYSDDDKTTVTSTSASEYLSAAEPSNPAPLPNSFALPRANATWRNSEAPSTPRNGSTNSSPDSDAQDSPIDKAAPRLPSTGSIADLTARMGGLSAIDEETTAIRRAIGRSDAAPPPSPRPSTPRLPHRPTPAFGTAPAAPPRTDFSRGGGTTFDFASRPMTSSTAAPTKKETAPVPPPKPRDRTTVTGLEAMWPEVKEKRLAAEALSSTTAAPTEAAKPKKGFTSLAAMWLKKVQEPEATSASHPPIPPPKSVRGIGSGFAPRPVKEEPISPPPVFSPPRPAVKTEPVSPRTSVFSSPASERRPGSAFGTAPSASVHRTVKTETEDSGESRVASATPSSAASGAFSSRSTPIPPPSPRTPFGRVPPPPDVVFVGEFKASRQLGMPTFQMSSAGFTAVSAVNESGKRLAYRIIWSNSRFTVYCGSKRERARQIFGFLKADLSHCFFQIVCQDGPPTTEVFTMQYVPASESEEDAGVALAYKRDEIKTVSFTLVVDN